MKIKDKKCKECGVLFSPSNSIQKVCSIACAIKFASKIENKNEEKRWKEKKREMVEKSKTISDYLNELQKDINKIVRLIDRGHNCISSDRPLASNINAGHFYSRGAYPSLRFNLHNIWNQSIHDNQYKSGNQNGYRENLTRLFGHSYIEYVDSLRSKYPSLKLSKEDVLEAQKRCKEIIKELQEEGFLDNQERLEIRYKLNKRIGIYND